MGLGQPAVCAHSFIPQPSSSPPSIRSTTTPTTETMLTTTTTRPVVGARPAATRRTVRSAALSKDSVLVPIAAAAAAALLVVAAPALAGEMLSFDASKATGVVQGLDVEAVKAAAAAAAAAPKAAAVAAASAAASGGLGDALADVNPATAAGVLAALGLPIGIFNLLKGKGGYKAAGLKPTGAAQAVEALAAGRAVLVDIRSKEEVREYGTPKLPAGAKLVSLPFTKVRGNWVERVWACAQRRERKEMKRG